MKLKSGVALGLAAVIAFAMFSGPVMTASSAPTHTTIRGIYSRTAYNNNRLYSDSDNSGGYSQGDIVTAHAILHKGGKATGKIVDFCGIVDDRGPGQVQCDSTFVRPKGDTITFSGQAADDPSPGIVHHASITGGTGRYARARGTVKIEFGEHAIHYVFRVITQ
ncbi:MAG: hypothetical protein QOC87_1029 [Actinomycetota bacterium]|jgi:hypothetical protein|nr:hypothetical protein [Actinomycetota bacterium]